MRAGDGQTDDTDDVQAAISANNTFASNTNYVLTDTPSTVYPRRVLLTLVWATEKRGGLLCTSRRCCVTPLVGVRL